MDEESKKVNKPMTEEELEQRCEEIFAKHRVDPLVQQAAWERAWEILYERAIKKLMKEAEKESEKQAREQQESEE